MVEADRAMEQEHKSKAEELAALEERKKEVESEIREEANGELKRLNKRRREIYEKKHLPQERAHTTQILYYHN